MRLILACSKCKRQYKASRAKSGRKFRCLCGEVIVVREPRGHDASVVTCSSCGAPREKQAADCSHCGSDFTLHERDLHTVCPSCLARISDKARYCHHCATPVVAELSTGESSDLACPVCGPDRKLAVRRLGCYSLGVLECQTCAGLWLGIKELDHVFELEARKSVRIVAPSKSSERTRVASGYLPCVVCQQLMSRRNFGRGRSGVILDVCGMHGLWFDADELNQLIAWVRAGGLEDARLDLALLKNSRDHSRRRIALENGIGGRRRNNTARAKSSRIEPEGIEPYDTNWLFSAAQIAAFILRRIV